MANYHAVIWIDHDEAHVIRFGRSDAESEIIKAPHVHLHQKERVVGAGRAPEHPEFYEKVIAAAKDSGELLIVGPADAKLHLVKHIERTHPAMSTRVVGVETVDHPSDGQLLAHARHYFKAADQMRGQ
jgi:hypothetical protein